MNGNKLKCGQNIKYNNKSYMILGFKGKTILRLHPTYHNTLVAFPSEIALSQIGFDTIYVPYGLVVDLSEYKIPKH